MKKKDKIKYSKRLVAFIDILGFSQIINSNSSNDIKNIKSFNKKLNHVTKILKKDYGKVFSVKMFSDCICLSCKYNTEKFELILSELSYIQLYFSIDGIFIRGGVSIGQHFENKSLIYSKGLIQAYELEKTAIYPRILIDDKVVELIKKGGINRGNNGKFSFLMKSPNDLYFLDYLYSDCPEPNVILKSHKDSIIKQVHNNENNNKVIEKYKWLSLYHNIKSEELLNKDKDQPLQESLLIDIKQVFPEEKGSGSN